MGLFSKKKDSKSLKDKWFLKGVFEPQENLQYLEAQYNKKRNSRKNEILRAETEGFLDGLKKRNNSRLSQLQKLREQQQKNKDQELER